MSNHAIVHIDPEYIHSFFANRLFTNNEQFFRSLQIFAIPENPSILIIKIPNDPKTPWSQKICEISILKFKAGIVENNMKRHP